MLENALVHPTLPVVDLERAIQFCEGKLGLKVIGKDPSPGAFLKAGGNTLLYIYQRAATKADHTAASFVVKDVEATVKGLQAKGLAFNEVDIPLMGVKTVDGVATFGQLKAAWFNDTEGNILGISNA